MNSPIPWQQQALSHWPLINRLAGHRFPQGELAEEAALFVMDKLAENDWQRMRAFGGQSSLATYLGSVTLRLLEDFARLRFGRIKAPLWVRRLGGLWKTLFRLLCLERFSPTEAVEILATRQACAAKVAENAAYQLLAEIPNCGSYRGEETELPDDLPAEGEKHSGSHPEQVLEKEERKQCLQALANVIFAEDTPDHKSRIMEKMLAVKINLEPRERLLLKLCFRDGVAVAEAGRMLGWNRHQAHGRLRRLLQRLRRDFSAGGLGQELELLLTT
ncbi:MAG: hypothetical protein PHI97_15170 [Desulfobulbus sp.]|nr:hypothetical protein [Desulfobulbus sp.]